MRRQIAAALLGAALVGAALLPAGCAQREAPPEVPAVLTNPTEQCRAELLRVVGEAMNGAPVIIADAALTADDTLIIEPAAGRDARDMNLGGRETRRPDHFQLVKSGSQCVLVHVESGRRWTLASATCSPRQGRGDT
jgi:hypothetical protein